MPRAIGHIAQPPRSFNPRVCGADAIASCIASATTLQSPRVRGRQRHHRQGADSGTSIPACAGQTTVGGGRDTRAAFNPRVCGADDLRCGWDFTFSLQSPRVRGRPLRGGRRFGARSSIPACAGQTGQRPAVRLGLHLQSPRVRGRRLILDEFPQLGPSIPACAGQTSSADGQRRMTPFNPRVCGADSFQKDSLNQELRRGSRGR